MAPEKYLRIADKRGLRVPHEAGRLVVVDDTIVRCFDDFTRDPGLLYGRRERIAGNIELLRRLS